MTEKQFNIVGKILGVLIVLWSALTAFFFATAALKQSPEFALCGIAALLGTVSLIGIAKIGFENWRPHTGQAREVE